MVSTRWLNNLILIVISSYLTLVTADAGIWFLSNQNKKDIKGLYQVDPKTGHAHVPGFNRDITTTYTFPVTINKHGFRDSEWTFDSQNRVLILGDSFIFGEPLPIEQGLVHNLQAHFNPKQVRFYNAGVSGYGLGHIAENLLKTCPIIKPNLILYALYLNDLSWDGLDPHSTTVIDGHLVQARQKQGANRLTDDEIRQRINKAQSQNQFSLLKLLSLGHLRNFFSKRSFSKSDNNHEVKLLTTDKDRYPPALTEKARKLLLNTIDQARNCGAEFAIVILASTWEAEFTLREPAVERLLKSLENDNLTILDLRDHAPSGIPLGLPKDNHYNPDANKWAGQLISNFLVEKYPFLK